MAMAGVTENGTTRRAIVDVVSANYFETFGVAPVRGRTFTPAEERPGAPALAAIASHSMWARSGFAHDILGRTVVLNGRSFTLVGVTPRGFASATVVIEPDYYVPLSAHHLMELVAGDHKTLDRRDYHRLLLIGARCGRVSDYRPQESPPLTSPLASAVQAVARAIGSLPPCTG